MARIKTSEEAMQKYGPIISGKWPNESQWMTLYDCPDWLEKHLTGLDGKPCKRIYCNKDLLIPLTRAFENVKDRGLLDQVKTFDGCFSIRMQRGSSDKISTHSYGLAIDIAAGENPLGQDPKMSKELVDCFTDVGFIWGGNFLRKDGMHFQYAEF